MVGPVDIAIGVKWAARSGLPQLQRSLNFNATKENTMARASENAKEQAKLEDAVLRAARKWYMTRRNATESEQTRAEQTLTLTTQDLLKHEGVL